MKEQLFFRTIVKAKSYWQLYVLLLLPLAYIIIFAYIPMYGVQIAFKKYSAAGGIYGSPWVGFDNFIKFFQSYQFRRVVTNTLTLSLYGLFAGFPFPIIFALLLNSLSSKRYKKITQTITYMPHFISTIIMVGILIQVFNPSRGIYGYIFSLFSNEAVPDLLGISTTFPHLYVWSGVWQEFGWGSIIYTAALAGISYELHEAAEIDGASRFKRMLYIDLPGLLPTITIMLILRAGQIMNVGFEKVFLMQNNLNLTNSEIISTYVYKVGLSAGGSANFSYSAAIGLFNSVVNLLLIIIVNAISKKTSETSLW